jgi:hypothetical protein
MANEETVEDRFLKELYGLTDGQATRVVRGEELARWLGTDPEEETDNARFLGTAWRVEDGGGRVRDHQQVRPRGARLLAPLVDVRGVRAVKKVHRMVVCFSKTLR